MFKYEVKTILMLLLLTMGKGGGAFFSFCQIPQCNLKNSMKFRGAVISVKIRALP